MAWRFGLIVVTTIFLTGCTTMRSTMLNRVDSDQYYRNGRPTKGVPITIKVPTHLDVYVYETFMLKKNGSNEFLQLEEYHAPTKSGQLKRNLRVVTKEIESDKVFTVDYKRPMAGSLTYNATFEGQSFKNINNMLDDDSINKTTDLVLASAALFGLAPPPSAEEGSQAADGQDSGDGKNEMNEEENADLTAATDNENKVTPYVNLGENLKGDYVFGERVVAYKRFDMNTPDFEEQVRQFIDSHMNCCNNCEASASFSAVNGLRTK